MFLDIPTVFLSHGCHFESLSVRAGRRISGMGDGADEILCTPMDRLENRAGGESKVRDPQIVIYPASGRRRASGSAPEPVHGRPDSLVCTRHYRRSNAAMCSKEMRRRRAWSRGWRGRTTARARACHPGFMDWFSALFGGKQELGPTLGGARATEPSLACPVILALTTSPCTLTASR